MNKVLCVFLAIVFICSVFAYGTNKRFSVAKWIDNLLSIGEGVTLEDFVDVWTQDRLVDYRALEALKELPFTTSGWHGDELIDHHIAYDENLNLITSVEFNGTNYALDIEWMRLTSDLGIIMKNPYYRVEDLEKSRSIPTYLYGNQSMQNYVFQDCWPIVTGSGTVTFGRYEGGNEVLEGFDNVLEFFDRLFYTFRLVGDAVGQVFRNLGNLLPWNATVEVT